MNRYEPPRELERSEHQEIAEWRKRLYRRMRRFWWIQWFHCLWNWTWFDRDFQFWIVEPNLWVILSWTIQYRKNKGFRRLGSGLFAFTISSKAATANAKRALAERDKL